MNPEQRTQVVEKVATRMKFPQLFGLVAALFVIDLLVPDVIPFIDEIILALMTVMLGMWRERADPGPVVTIVPPEVRKLPGPPPPQ